MEKISQGKIKVLPDFIIKQIAAGEVVQRPESVVKELVENSLDAGSDTIAIVIRGGGKKLIHVVDNGCGMSRDDLMLSVKRHTTSKIYSPEDLEAIRTYGFRGEALASISSVSQLEIRSRTKDSEIGWKLYCEPNSEPTVEPINMDFGTQVFVRNLFFNVPARRKFLKSDLTEFRYISDLVMRIALVRFDVRFVFYDEDSLVFDVPKSNLEQRINDLLGDLVYGSIMKVDYEERNVRISGYIGQPHLAKISRGGQYLYLNGRIIKSRSLNYAIFLAYEHLLEKQTNPFYLLNIEIDPKEYDINVHPQKYEVKFEDDRLIFQLISNAINQTLSQHNLAPSVAVVDSYKPIATEKSVDTGSSGVTYFNKITGEVLHSWQSQGSGKNFQHTSFQTRLQYSAHSGTNQITQIQENLDALFAEKFSRRPNFYQFHNKYIVVETEKGIMIIDQHAAHERIIYEKLVNSVNSNRVISQELLFPLSIRFTPSEISILREISNELRNLGLDFEIESENRAVFKSLPLDILGKADEMLLREIISGYSEIVRNEKINSRDAIIASISCKAAIKTGQKLSNEEIENLITELFRCEIPYACPHGRPVVIELTLEELDKNFCRIG